MPPVVPVIANVAASPVSDPEAIRDALVRQVTGTVRWRESVAFMADPGRDAVFRDGCGKGADGACEAHRPAGATGQAVGAPDDIQKVRQAL